MKLFSKNSFKPYKKLTPSKNFRKCKKFQAKQFRTIILSFCFNTKFIEYRHIDRPLSQRNSAIFLKIYINALKFVDWHCEIEVEKGFFLFFPVFL